MLVGCKKTSNEKLKCTLKQEQDENSIVQTIEVNFENDKVISINMKMQTLLNDKYIPYIDLFVTNMEEQFSYYSDKRGVTSNIHQDESSVIVSILFSINNMEEQVKSELGFINVDDSYESNKHELEQIGYVCS